MTALTMRFAGAVGRTLQPGRRGRLHAPRPRRQRRARGSSHAERNGAHGPLRRARARRRSSCPPSAVEAVLSDRTRWVAVTARLQRGRHDPRPARASSPPPTRAGARVYVDAVHAAPHRRDRRRRARLRRARLLGLQVVRPARRRPVGAARSCSRELTPDKLRPSPDDRPRPLGERARRRSRRWPASRAAADYTRGDGLGRGARARGRTCWPARSRASTRIDGVTLHGRARDRTPTLMFTVEGRTPTEVAAGAGRARGRRLGRQLLRLGARALPRPRARTARSAPASCTTTTSATSSGCSTRSSRSSAAGGGSPGLVSPPPRRRRMK